METTTKFQSTNNKWAKVLPNVKLTPTIDRALVQVEETCRRRQFSLLITSGQRSAEHQLKIIRNYAISKGLAKTYSQAMTCQLTDTIGDLYVWQPLWSKLCNIGLIIAPPISCKALLDYNYFGRNLKGLVCPASNHIPGNAFDIDGGDNGIDDETEVITWGIQQGIITFIINIVPERKNNCLHSNCIPIKSA